MGNESDRLVFDYLSRVGDLAQQRQLSSAERMRLVAEVRGEIERRSAGAPGTPARTRRLLDRIGTPEDLVTAAGGRSGRGTGRATGRDGTEGATGAGLDDGRGLHGHQDVHGRDDAYARDARDRDARDREARDHAGGAADVPAAQPAPPAPESRTSPAGGSGKPGPFSGIGGREAVPEQRAAGEGVRGPGAAGTFARLLGLRPPGAPKAPDAGDGGAAGGEGRGHGEREPGGMLPKSLRRRAPRPRTPEERGPSPSYVADAPSPPHLAGTGELGSGQAEWWRTDRRSLGPGEDLPGFTGGIEVPEILRPPPVRADLNKTPADLTGATGEEAAEDEESAEEEEPAAGRRLRLLPTRAPGNPLLLLAAVALLAGAVLGNLVALGAGWLLVHLSRRLTFAESRTAVLVLPGLSLVGGIVWLWGRNEGRWGEAVASGHFGDAIGETWPWVVRAAAVSSALFVIWRSQRAR